MDRVTNAVSQPPGVRVLAILQARMSSSRLRGKVLADLVGAPMIVRQIERIRRARMIDDFVVATSLDPTDDELAKVVTATDTRVMRGSLSDVLDRFAMVIRETRPEHVVRLTGDCPLVDPDIVNAMVAQHLVGGADITTNALERTFPDGLDVEVMRAEVLLAAAVEGTLDIEREHVTQFIYRRPDRFKFFHYKSPRDLSGLRWTVDEPEDLALVRAVYEALYPQDPCFGFRNVLDLVEARPELNAINGRLARKNVAHSVASQNA